MLHAFEDKVRLRAYEIWLSAGMGDGMAHDHWMSAEHAIMHERPTKVQAQGAPRAKTAASVPAEISSGKPSAKEASTKKASTKKALAPKSIKQATARPSKAKAARITN